ncbi:hypothetical protein MJO28_004321 [Puccinia striiformis f. sp. tritici]|uniref:Uncharacterized protein n=4 Tax=Puccinia striiformis TaxID=27350 RepID=A0A0L0VEK7_9BASI|nr:hypothetical protein MJO28_004321 [Puccinia striiformis f. sp. tritici]KAI9608589.1 hypothetical protein H4Q26_004772 [Puccinia striiformis f. sp. tritici PST-130]KNE97710.1 hypothetical protein PSTG_08931 [Puccinia striiformis f. sp. tritici PST-78]POV98590.1 hypothetical protein PSTT_14290 [Puccinia striiformis]KAI7963538.1 hypothetical protein MJO29_003965 [Puccinia striiformis f. sp. tritici]
MPQSSRDSARQKSSNSTISPSAWFVISGFTIVVAEIDIASYFGRESAPRGPMLHPKAWIIYLERAETYRKIGRLAKRATGPMGRPKRQETQLIYRLAKIS